MQDPNDFLEEFNLLLQSIGAENTSEQILKSSSKYRRTYESESDSDQSDAFSVRSFRGRPSVKANNMNYRNNSSVINYMPQLTQKDVVEEEPIKEPSVKDLNEAEILKDSNSVSVDKNPQIETLAIVEPVDNVRPNNNPQTESLAILEPIDNVHLPNINPQIETLAIVVPVDNSQLPNNNPQIKTSPIVKPIDNAHLPNNTPQIETLAIVKPVDNSQLPSNNPQIETSAIVKPCINNAHLSNNNSSLKRKIGENSTPKASCSSMKRQMQTANNTVPSIIIKKSKLTAKNVPSASISKNLNFVGKEKELHKNVRNYCDASNRHVPRPRYNDNGIINMQQRLYLYPKPPPHVFKQADTRKKRQFEIQKAKMRELIPDNDEVFFYSHYYDNNSKVYRTFGIDSDTDMYKYVAEKFYETYGRNNIIAIDRLNNSHSYIRFRNRVDALKSTNSEFKILHLFHGTRMESLDSILKNNFQWKLFGFNVGNKFGKGISFASKASYSVHYTDKRNDCNVMLLAQVIVRNFHVGSKTTVLPLHGFDTTVSHNGQVWVKYHDDECYIDYVIYFQHVSDDSINFRESSIPSRVLPHTMASLTFSPYSDFNNPIQ